MKAEQLLIAEGIHFDIIPTPKEYSSDCGMSIRILKNTYNMEKIKVILTTHPIKFKIHEN